MKRKRLTDLSVRAIKPKAKYFEVVDASGLRFGIQPSGTISPLTRYRRPGSKRPAKLVHGRYPSQTLAEARVRHAEALRLIAQGVDPGLSKQRLKIAAEHAEADTIEAQVQAHLERQRREVVESTWQQACLALEGDVVRAWRGRHVSEIKRRDVIALNEKIAERRGPIAANRAFQHIRRFFNVLLARDVISVSPCVGVKRPSPERTRDRVLADGEIRSLWHALDAVGGPAAACAKLLLYTGQRRSECACLVWGELDGDVWSLASERTKNRKPHAVALSRQVRELIEQQPKDSAFVFTSGNRPVADWSRLKREVDAIMQPERGWTWHDLRRSCASGLQRLGVPIHVTEAVLNHRSGTVSGVTAIYQRHDYLIERANALQAWADYLDQVVSGEPAGKVVRLRGRS
jgi:integrase